MKKKNKLVFGVGINNFEGSCIENGKNIKSYNTWTKMLERSYSSKYHKKHPTYIGCSISDEWKYFSNFKQWFDSNYIDGLQLDKDLLIRGNKIYSYETCVFIPSEINSLLTKTDAKRGQYPVGVCFNKKANKFQSQCNNNGKPVHLGYFNSPEEAFLKYKQFKENLIQETAVKYLNERKINFKTFYALMEYEVEITD